MVIVDLHLAEGSVIEAAETIDAENESLPVVVRTLLVTRDVKGRAFAAGTDAYLTKAYEAVALREALGR